MTLHIPSRRGFLFGAGALLAAPAIVRVASIMPVSAVKTEYEPFRAEFLFERAANGRAMFSRTVTIDGLVIMEDGSLHRMLKRAAS